LKSLFGYFLKKFNFFNLIILFFTFKLSFDQDRSSQSRNDLEEGNYPDYFVKKEAPSPPGSIKNITNANNNDTEAVSTILQLKTEPVGNSPDSPESSSIDNSHSLLPGYECAGCRRLIQV
jgi:hypothetical protein